MKQAREDNDSNNCGKINMSRQNNGVEERRGGTPRLISNMLNERNQLLSLLLRAYELKEDESGDIDRELLNEFCQVLVDYIAAGHFGLYERIVEGTERRRGVADLAVKLYPRIDETTQAALAFNEKYEADRDDIDLSGLHEELSLLGEELTTRIEYEDQLINELSRA